MIFQKNIESYIYKKTQIAIKQITKYNITIMFTKYNSLADIWEKSCIEYASLDAFCDKDLKTTISYKEAYDLLAFLKQEFIKLNVQENDNISLFAINSPYWLIIEQALISAGAICVSKTSQVSFDELDYIYYNSDSKALITDSKEIVDCFTKKNPDFTDKNKFILYLGNENFENNSKIINFNNILKNFKNYKNLPKDIKDKGENTAYINYTSGTSSKPKGAMLPNNGMAYVVEELQKFCEIKKGSTFVVTFPLSSAGGKSFNLLCFSKGSRLIYTQYKDFFDVIEKYKPDYLHCAPKILQTMYQKMIKFVDSKGFLFKITYNLAFKIAKDILKCEIKSQKENHFNKKIKQFLDKLVFKKVRNVLFKDDIILFVGSAHLAPALEDYFRIINVPLIQHYGLTETTGLAVSNSLESQLKYPYTVGVGFKGTKIEIIDPETKKELPPNKIGLIALIGPEILKGYYNNIEATKKALIKENCLNTGDLGYVNNKGYLTVLTRYDDVVVLSNGYNIFTPLLENEAKDSKFINQIVIAGHGKPYLCALVVLNNEEYKIWCKNNSSDIKNPNNNKKFIEFLIEHLNEKIKRKNDFKYYEKVKKIYFISQDFSIENDMLTNTLKVKRNKICKVYNKEIESLYKG